VAAGGDAGGVVVIAEDFVAHIRRTADGYDREQLIDLLLLAVDLLADCDDLVCAS